jgi:hypothetical protein
MIQIDTIVGVFLLNEFYFQMRFNAGLIRIVDQIKIILLLLKIQWKEHHYLYTKIVYNVIMNQGKVSLSKRRGKVVK